MCFNIQNWGKSQHVKEFNWSEFSNCWNWFCCQCINQAYKSHTFSYNGIMIYSVLRSYCTLWNCSITELNYSQFDVLKCATLTLSRLYVRCHSSGYRNWKVYTHTRWYCLRAYKTRKHFTELDKVFRTSYVHSSKQKLFSAELRNEQLADNCALRFWSVLVNVSTQSPLKVLHSIPNREWVTEKKRGAHI